MQAEIKQTQELTMMSMPLRFLYTKVCKRSCRWCVC